MTTIIQKTILLVDSKGHCRIGKLVTTTTSFFIFKRRRTKKYIHSKEQAKIFSNLFESLNLDGYLVLDFKKLPVWKGGQSYD